MSRYWRVVGGADKGGILVRSGESLNSSALAERLGAGAVVRGLALTKSGRLQYELLVGLGPMAGWVSIRALGKELLVACRFPSDKDISCGSSIPSREQQERQQQFAAAAAAVPRQLASPPSTQLVQLLFGQHACLPSCIEEIEVPRGRALRVVAISDVHADYAQNLKWLEQHLPGPTRACNQFNVLLLAGDVCDEIGKLQETLDLLLRGFDLVCFTPGNHDLWVLRTGSPEDSLAKFQQVLHTCAALGVKTGPLRLRHAHDEPSPVPDLLLAPLLSFYSSDWDHEPDPPWIGKEQREMPGWVDFRAIKWPPKLELEVRKQWGEQLLFGSRGTSRHLGEMFAAANETWLEKLIAMRNEQTELPPVVISFSHFVPQQELVPEKRFLLDAMLHRVSGSRPLGDQVRRLAPDVHVFGHTHLSLDVEVQGQRYIQWALGNPREQKKMTNVVADTGMLVLYDTGGDPPHLAPVQFTYWGNYFRSGPRAPSEFCPPSYLRKFIRHQCPNADIPGDDEYFQQTRHGGPSIMSYDGRYEARWRQ